MLSACVLLRPRSCSGQSSPTFWLQQTGKHANALLVAWSPLTFAGAPRTPRFLVRHSPAIAPGGPASPCRATGQRKSWWQQQHASHDETGRKRCENQGRSAPTAASGVKLPGAIAATGPCRTTIPATNRQQRAAYYQLRVGTWGVPALSLSSVCCPPRTNDAGGRASPAPMKLRMRQQRHLAQHHCLIPATSSGNRPRWALLRPAHAISPTRHIAAVPSSTEASTIRALHLRLGGNAISSSNNGGTIASAVSFAAQGKQHRQHRANSVGQLAGNALQPAGA